MLRNIEPANGLALSLDGTRLVSSQGAHVRSWDIVPARERIAERHATSVERAGATGRNDRSRAR